MEDRRERSRTNRAPSAPAAPGGVRQEITGLLIAASGIWFFLALAGVGGGILGNFLAQGLKTLSGEAGAWVLAGLSVWFGLYLIYLRFHKRPFEWGRRATGLLLVFLAFQLFLQLWEEGGLPNGGDIENARIGIGGGLIGYALAYPLTKIFGHAGRWVVLVVGALVGLILNTEFTLGAVINWVKDRMVDGAKGAGGAAGDFYKLVTTKSSRPDLGEIEDPEAGPPLKKKAATEDLNTLTPKPAPPRVPEVKLPDLKRPEGGSGAATAEARPEPIIRRAEPLVTTPGPASAAPLHAPVPVAAATAGDLADRASRSVQAAADRAERPSRTKVEEIPAAKLVPDPKGQLQLDPDRLGERYQLPSLAMLPKSPGKAAISKDFHLERAELLERTLKTFGVEARVIEISPGPAVTRYELQPGEGVRVNKFTNLAGDLALALAAQDIRIEAPIPGKAAVGIEVPNKEREYVTLREVMETPIFQASNSKLSVAFGKDNAGNAVVGDLTKMPHMIIAGSTGSGKSICMNSIISSILFKARPDEVKMLMIDPKMVELTTYNGIPHLMAPVVTDPKKAAGYLKGAVKEMENRYEAFAAVGARNIAQYNQWVLEHPGEDPENPLKPLPYIVIFVDELADLMMVAPGDVEDSICRLAQMARACGMHLVIATQSPRVDVITGLIKANIPSKIAFAVSSQIDSRVILDYAGAERLLGRGDMLYHPSGLSKAIRAQGAFIDEKQVEELVRFVKAQAKPVYTAQEVAVELGKKGANGNGAGGEVDVAPSSAADAIFPQAVRVVIEHGQASVSILQRRLRCNYNKAARLIDMMEEKGFIGPHQGSKPRDVLVSLPQWHEMFGDLESGGEPIEGEE